MTITFEEYIEACERLPNPYSSNVPQFRVVLTAMPSMLYQGDITESPNINSTVRILTFNIATWVNHNGRRQFYWKPDATIVP